jgi:hypothetical protein
MEFIRTAPPGLVQIEITLEAAAEFHGDSIACG